MAAVGYDARASVYLGGARLSSKWDGTSVIALAGLTITWGLASRYGEARPAQLKLELIDPTGRWALDADLVGTPIKVMLTRRELVGWETPLFRGRVSDLTATRSKIRNPNTGETVECWRISVDAHDPLADLAQSKRLGPGPNGVWPQQSVEARMNAVLAAARSDDLQTIDTFGDPTTQLAARDDATLLALIQSAYAAKTPDPVQYIPQLAAIYRAFSANHPGLLLEFYGGQLIIRLLGNSKTIDANNIEVPSGYALASTVADAIDVVQVGWQASDGTDRVTERTAARYAPSLRGARTYKTDTDLVGTDAQAAALTAARVAVVDTLNGQFSYPPIEWRSNRASNYDEDLVFVRLEVQPACLYFLGSVFNGLPNVPAVHQIIGGRLTFNGDYWRARPTLAPALNPPPTVALDQLVTNPTPTFADFDPRITIGDLASITQGAS